LVFAQRFAPSWLVCGCSSLSGCWSLLDLRDLPEAIACEMLYAAWRLLDLGAAVHVGDTSTFLRDLRDR
jgi:hypothetical protein